MPTPQPAPLRLPLPAPTPVTPRASSGVPGDPEGADPALAELLDRYAALMVLTPRPDWMRQVHERIAQEAALTPSRRFLLALGALAPRPMLVAIRQNAAAVFGRGTFPAAVRAQALAVMLIAALSVGVVGAGGAMVLQAILPPADGPTRTLPQPTPQPTLQPTGTDAPRRTPAGESPAMRVDDRSPADPNSAAPTSPAPTSAAPAPTVGGQPSPPADGRGVGGPSSEDGTKKPRPTPKSEKPQMPRPTPRSEKPQKPHPTPRSEKPQKPQPTPRSEKPQKPHPRSKADKTQKPHPTPRGGQPEESSLDT